MASETARHSPGASDHVLAPCCCQRRCQSLPARRLHGAVHRLWIAVGNEALAYVKLAGLDLHVDQPWARPYQLRNKLAHRRLPDEDEDEDEDEDADEDEDGRLTALRPGPLRKLVHELLR